MGRRRQSPHFPKEAVTQSGTPEEPVSQTGRAQGDASDRPTLAPSFDLEEFAKSKLGEEGPLRAPPDTQTQPPPPPGSHLTMEPESGLRMRTAGEVTDLLAEPMQRFATGDYAGALTLGEALLEEAPDSENVRSFVEDCRRALESSYIEKLGSLHRVLSLSVTPDELRALPLDHRAGFLISHVDGVSTIEMVLDVSGMPRLDALRLLFGFIAEGIVRVE